MRAAHPDSGTGYESRIHLPKKVRFEVAMAMCRTKTDRNSTLETLFTFAPPRLHRTRQDIQHL